MSNKIEAQTKILSDQFSLLKQLSESGDDEKYRLELEKYNLMLKGADFSIESQAASKKRELKWYDKAFAPQVNRITRQVKKINTKIIKYNMKNNMK